MKTYLNELITHSGLTINGTVVAILDENVIYSNETRFILVTNTGKIYRYTLNKGLALLKTLPISTGRIVTAFILNGIYLFIGNDANNRGVIYRGDVNYLLPAGSSDVTLIPDTTQEPILNARVINNNVYISYLTKVQNILASTEYTSINATVIPTNSGNAFIYDLAGDGSFFITVDRSTTIRYGTTLSTLNSTVRHDGILWYQVFYFAPYFVLLGSSNTVAIFDKTRITDFEFTQINATGLFGSHWKHAIKSTDSLYLSDKLGRIIKTTHYNDTEFLDNLNWELVSVTEGSSIYALCAHTQV